LAPAVHEALDSGFRRNDENVLSLRPLRSLRFKIKNWKCTRGKANFKNFPPVFNFETLQRTIFFISVPDLWHHDQEMGAVRLGSTANTKGGNDDYQIL
jgi:hypothetical protein